MPPLHADSAGSVAGLFLGMEWGGFSTYPLPGAAHDGDMTRLKSSPVPSQDHAVPVESQDQTMGQSVADSLMSRLGLHQVSD